MADDSEKQEVLEVLERCKALDSQREDLFKRQITLQERHNQAVQALEEIKVEMEAIGTSPEKIEGDLEKAKQVLISKVNEYERSLGEYKSTIETAEKALAEIITRKIT